MKDNNATHEHIKLAAIAAQIAARAAELSAIADAKYVNACEDHDADKYYAAYLGARALTDEASLYAAIALIAYQQARRMASAAADVAASSEIYLAEAYIEQNPAYRTKKFFSAYKKLGGN